MTTGDGIETLEDHGVEIILRSSHSKHLHADA